MQCCDPASVLFSLEFGPNPNADPLTPVDGSPLGAHFDVITTDELSHPIRLTAAQLAAAGALAATLGDLLAVDQCLNPRLEFAAGIIHTLD